MVSAFDVYLVMQLDSIGAFLTFSAVFVAAALGVTGGVHAMNADMYGGERGAASRESRDRAFKRLWIPVLLGTASALIPSSKTAAAMILVPALTSEAVVAPVSAEARELFDLAKAALRNVAEREPEPAKE